MAADESDPSLEYGAAAASIAILAGIAAADGIEAGKRDPRVSTVERLARAVNLRPGQLLE